ncbi:hypothetical protein ACVIHD_000156 [Bradyrhizobium embrapense]
MIGAGHRLAADLGGTIEVLVVERMVFRHRLLDGIAIDGSRRRPDQPLDAVAHASVQDVEHPVDVDVKSRPREFVTLQQPERSELEHPVGSLQRRIEDIGLRDVAAGLEDLDAGVAQRAGKVLMRAAHEIVVNDDLADVSLRQLIDRMRPDQPGAPDNDNLLSANVHFLQPSISTSASL